MSKNKKHRIPTIKLFPTRKTEDTELLRTYRGITQTEAVTHFFQTTLPSQLRGKNRRLYAKARKALSNWDDHLKKLERKAYKAYEKSQARYTNAATSFTPASSMSEETMKEPGAIV